MRFKIAKRPKRRPRNFATLSRSERAKIDLEIAADRFRYELEVAEEERKAKEQAKLTRARQAAERKRRREIERPAREQAERDRRDAAFRDDEERLQREMASVPPAPAGSGNDFKDYEMFGHADALLWIDEDLVWKSVPHTWVVATIGEKRYEMQRDLFRFLGTSQEPISGFNLILKGDLQAYLLASKYLDARVARTKRLVEKLDREGIDKRARLPTSNAVNEALVKENPRPLRPNPSSIRGLISHQRLSELNAHRALVRDRSLDYFIVSPNGDLTLTTLSLPEPTDGVIAGKGWFRALVVQPSCSRYTGGAWVQDNIAPHEVSWLHDNLRRSGFSSSAERPRIVAEIAAWQEGFDRRYRDWTRSQERLQNSGGSPAVPSDAAIARAAIDRLRRRRSLRWSKARFVENALRRRLRILLGQAVRRANARAGD